MKIISEIRVNEKGEVVSIKGNTLSFENELRELINKVIDEREENKRLQEEIKKLQLNLFIKEVFTNPNKFKNEK